MTFDLKSPGAEYTVHMFFWMLLYMALIFGAVWFIRHHHPTGPLLYAVAVLPALPIGGTILTFLRFIERLDEYVRAVMTRRFIIATGLTLFIATVVGFVENFAETRLMDHYLVYAVFWGCWGATCLFVRGSK